MFDPVMESYYETYNDVLEDQAIERGWIPEFLPKSARNIVEEHNIETNFGFVEFSFSNGDRQIILPYFHNVTSSEIEDIKERMPSVKELDIDGKIDFYVTQNSFEKGFLVVNWYQKRAVYWYIPKRKSPRGLQ